MSSSAAKFSKLKPEESSKAPSGFGARFSRPDDALRAGGPKKAPTGKAALTGLIDSLMSGDLLGGLSRPTTVPSRSRGLRSQAPKAASNITHRDVRKKFGVRRGYSILQLLSVRNFCKSFPEGCEEIPNAFQEGIGDETAMNMVWDIKEKQKEKEKEESAALPTSRRTKFTNSQKKGPSALSSRKTTKSPQAKSSSPTEPISSSSSSEKKKAPKVRKPKTKINKKDPAATKSYSNSNKKNEPTEPLTDFAPLKVSKTGWRRDRPKTRQEKLRGKITDTLNKITYEKFDTLAHLLIETIEKQIETKQELEIAISQIFKKTVQESTFGKLYADLCCQIVAKNQEFQDDLNDEKVTFKDALINQCQNQFENAYQPVKLDDVTDPYEREERLSKQKKDALGTVQFIGELYNKGLLPNKICSVCLKELIMIEDPTDLQIESAYKLLRTIGKKYDSEDGKRKGDSGKKHLDNIFALLKQQTKKNAKRVRILVDILEGIRANNWVPTVAGDEAKTLEQVREEFIKSKGGNKISNSRGQPTIDEWMTEASNKVYKQLKYAVKGGCAIKRTEPEMEAAQSNSKAVPDFFNNMMLQSGSVVDEKIMGLMADVKETVLDDKQDFGVDLFDKEKREEQLDGNHYIKSYLSDALDNEKAPTALSKFIRVCKKIGFNPRSELITNLLNMAYDVKPEEAPAIGKALAEAVNQKYVSAEQLETGFIEFCSYYTSVEMDAPKLNQYFADMTLYLVVKGHTSVDKIMEFMGKDPGIEKNIRRHAFGRRADYLGYLARAAQTGGYEISYNATSFIIAEKTEDEWKERYGVK